LHRVRDNHRFVSCSSSFFAKCYVIERYYEPPDDVGSAASETIVLKLSVVLLRIIRVSVAPEPSAVSIRDASKI